MSIKTCSPKRTPSEQNQAAIYARRGRQHQLTKTQAERRCEVCGALFWPFEAERHAGEGVPIPRQTIGEVNATWIF